MIQAVTRSGDRSTYYRVAPDAWSAMLRRRLESIASFSDITDEGLGLFPQGAHRAERLREAHRVFEWLNVEAEPLLKRWDDVRDTFTPDETAAGAGPAPATPPADHPHGKKDTVTNEDARRWWALAAIGLSLLTVSVDATILNVALPTVSTELGASTSDLQWFVDSFTLAMAALLLPAGLLGDRLGRKTMLMASLFLFGLASLWCAYSGSAGMLIAARTVLGISAAFLVPLCTSVLLDIFEGEHERAKAIGVIAVTQSLGLPLGPIIGGALLNHFWWGSVFLINVPLVALGLLAVARLVPSSRGSQHGVIDFLGVLLSSVGLVALVYGAIEAGEKGWSDPRSLLPLIGGLALLVVFVLWEIRVAVSRDPLLDLSLFRNAGFVWGSILGTVVSFAMFGLIFALPQYFQAVDGTDALGTGLRLLPLIGGVLVSAAVIRSSPEAAPARCPRPVSSWSRSACSWAPGPRSPPTTGSWPSGS